MLIGTSSLRSSSSGACRLSARVTGMPSSVSWRIRGTRPTVDTVTPRADMPSPSGVGSDEAAYGADDRLVVGERLPHAHEHDVRDPARAAGDLAAGHRPGAGDDLLDDLGGRHVALQPALAGGAERAGHAAPGLARDADRWRGRGSASGPTRRGRRRRASTASCAWCRGRPRGCAAGSSASAGTPRPAGPARPRAGRSSRPGRRPAARSSAWRAAWPGTPAARARSASAARSSGPRSARCRGGFLRPRGSSNTSGSGRDALAAVGTRTRH